MKQFSTEWSWKMLEFLEFTIDKFTFRVGTDRWYDAAGVWAMPEGENVRIGVSDFLQQRSGDVAFAEVKSAGTHLAQDDDIAVIETIKVDITLGSPVNGTIVEVNPALETAPEFINQDPYGKGWLAVVGASNWETDRAHLLDPQTYFERIKKQVEEETR
jgi:glycine cleavage system H protein